MQSPIDFLPAVARIVPGLLAAALLASAQAREAGPAPAARPVEVNGIAAKVNGRVITRNELSFNLAPIHSQLVVQYPRRGERFEAELKAARDKVLQELIDREIVLDEFKQLGAQIKSHIVEQEVKGQIRELYNGDEAKFREELKRSRLTMDGYREMTREKMIVQQMRALQFADAPPPLPNEIENEYGEIRSTLRETSKDVLTFRKIFIPSIDPSDPASTPDSQLARTDELAAQLGKGADFAELAKEHSKDAYAESGGLQESVPRTDLSPEFAAIIVDKPEGAIVGPLKDPAGFTIIQVGKIQFGPSPPLADERVRELVEERVRKKKTSAQYERWIESRRKRAMIDIRM